MGNHLREIETAIEGTETSDRSTVVRPQHYGLLVVLFAAVIFLSGIISPPSLMDDVDAA